MDFNTIYELVAPYLGTTGIVGIIITILTVFIKCRGVIKKSEKAINNFISDIKERWDNTESEALKAFKSALPKDLFINIETIAKSELSAIKEEIWNAVNEKWLGQITKNTDLTEAIALALIDNKTIPDSDKKLIAELLQINDAHTTKALKVELVQVEEPSEEKQEKTTVLID
jgi:hypothetical protein